MSPRAPPPLEATCDPPNDERPRSGDYAHSRRSTSPRRYCPYWAPGCHNKHTVRTLHTATHPPKEMETGGPRAAGWLAGAA